MSIPQSSIQGSIFELVVRGKKDNYFVADNQESTYIFNSKYESTAPFLGERRTFVPYNAQRFGSTFEIEIDKYGDILTQCGLLIQLPTWLPSLPTSGNTTGVPVTPVEPIRANSLYWIKDTSGVSYGYTNYIGYLMFESIQFYQDQILIQEWSGDGLLATNSTEGSWNSSFLQSQFVGGASVGISQTSIDRSIALRATPGLLRLSLPLPGMQTPGDGGFPLCCAISQTFRFRIKLRKLEDLIECTNPFQYKPAPWNIPTLSYTPTGSATPYVFSPIAFDKIGEPTIMLETMQLYIPPAIRQEMQNSKRSIPYRRQFQNIFTFGENDYKMLATGGASMANRRLDARHPVERLVYFFRTANAIDTNRLYDFKNPTGGDDFQFYNEMKLVIAGRERENNFSSLVWQNIESFAKDERDSGLNIGEMRWNLGDVYERIRPFSRVYEGGVNFSTADRPTLHMSLNIVPPQMITNQLKSEMIVFMEGWAIYEFQEGRARSLFAN